MLTEKGDLLMMWQWSDLRNSSWAQGGLKSTEKGKNASGQSNVGLPRRAPILFLIVSRAKSYLFRLVCSRGGRQSLSYAYLPSPFTANRAHSEFDLRLLGRVNLPPSRVTLNSDWVLREDPRETSLSRANSSIRGVILSPISFRLQTFHHSISKSYLPWKMGHWGQSSRL